MCARKNSISVGVVRVSKKEEEKARLSGKKVQSDISRGARWAMKSSLKGLRR